jgi:hypothetical protein
VVTLGELVVCDDTAAALGVVTPLDRPGPPMPPPDPPPPPNRRSLPLFENPVEAARDRHVQPGDALWNDRITVSGAAPDDRNTGGRASGSNAGRFALDAW